ncbi:hypothetical protein ABFS83_04G049700 [Erythranthe nasuta]
MVKNEAVEQDLKFTPENVGVEMAAAVGGGAVVEEAAGFEAMEEDHQDLWLDRDQDDLLDVNDASIFYDDFPPLPDFPCMSSSSSSSSTPAASRPTAVTSSSSSATSSSPAASWPMMKSDGDEFKDCCEAVKMEPAALSSTASMDIPPPPPAAAADHDGLCDVDCINVMENFGYMDLIDSNEIWDPSSIFQSENPQDFLADDQHTAVAPPPPPQNMDCQDQENDSFSSFLEGNSELAFIFFEWLKQNRDYISAEDMRNIKLKRSTIENASKRLGSNKEGKKQLLKLILEWVENYQLQKKPPPITAEGGGGPQSPNPNPNPNPNFNYTPLPHDPNTCFSAPTWMPPAPPPDQVSSMMAQPPPPFSGQHMAGYSGDPYSNQIPMVPMHHQVVNGIAYQHSPEYAQSWPISPYPMPPPPHHQFSPYPDSNGHVMTHHHHQHHHQQTVYGNPYQVYDPNGERLMRLGSSATKEARKKRMARQKKMYSHHHRHSSNSGQNQSQLNDPDVVGDGGDEGDNWYWSGGGGDASSPTNANAPPGDDSQTPSGDRPSKQPQTNQKQGSDKRQQGWKSEKNLKFLLQKVLKQSDVGNLGRIVLPKKEAESHLPELETRDGMTIAMEDIGSSRVWNMRYRFWPNNKSRMYLLENTGDFVRVNGLQEGDFIVIYSDTKCGKYMIRGVKVRQPGAKMEGKKPARRNMRNMSFGGNSSSLMPIKQAAR